MKPTPKQEAMIKKFSKIIGDTEHSKRQHVFSLKNKINTRSHTEFVTGEVIINAVIDDIYEDITYIGLAKNIKMDVKETDMTEEEKATTKRYKKALKKHSEELAEARQQKLEEAGVYN